MACCEGEGIVTWSLLMVMIGAEFLLWFSLLTMHVPKCPLLRDQTHQLLHRSVRWLAGLREGGLKKKRSKSLLVFGSVFLGRPVQDKAPRSSWSNNESQSSLQDQRLCFVPCVDASPMAFPSAPTLAARYFAIALAITITTSLACSLAIVLALASAFALTIALHCPCHCCCPSLPLSFPPVVAYSSAFASVLSVA